jgi:hypothetical protein
MKVHSLTILHYGADYLSYALRSVYHSVDQLHVFYTPTPSHGHTTNIPPIETKENLMQAAYAYDPDNKVVWYDMLGITHEGPQRDLALKTVEAAGAELVLVVDYDEIWPVDTLKRALVYAKINPNKTYQFLVNMTHLWRSFNWCCKDEGWPVRLLDMRYPRGNEYLSDIGKVYHFGYAVTNRVMQYKWRIHGHKNELRPEWFNEIWMHWPPYNKEAIDLALEKGWDISCHPTNENNFWIPKPFDKAELPAFMAEHPFFGLDKIE